jgi:hypothetical protein
MFDEDLSPFFVEFASSVTATPEGGAPVEFRGIFSDADLAARLGAMPVDLASPRLVARTADVSGFPRGTVLEVEGQPGQFRLAEHLPDGTGVSTIILAPVTERDAAGDALHDELTQ